MFFQLIPESAHLIFLLCHIFAQITLQLWALILRLAMVLLHTRHILLQLINFVV